MVLALFGIILCIVTELDILGVREMSIFMHERINGMRLITGKEICLFFYEIFIYFPLERNICFTCKKNKLCYCVPKIITSILTLFEIELVWLYIITIINSSWVEKMFLEKNMHSHA